MIIHDIRETLGDYKKHSLLISVGTCSGKCWKELGLDESICHNNILKESVKDMSNDRIVKIIKGYIEDGMISSVIFGGLEPIEQIEDIKYIINEVEEISKKYVIKIDIVIYTGFYREEIEECVESLTKDRYNKLIIKYGRFIPNSKSRYDKVLGITLSSDNQYALVEAEGKVDCSDCIK